MIMCIAPDTLFILSFWEYNGHQVNILSVGHCRGVFVGVGLVELFGPSSQHDKHPFLGLCMVLLVAHGSSNKSKLSYVVMPCLFFWGELQHRPIISKPKRTTPTWRPPRRSWVLRRVLCVFRSKSWNMELIQTKRGQTKWVVCPVRIPSDILAPKKDILYGTMGTSTIKYIGVPVQICWTEWVKVKESEQNRMWL